MAGDIAEQFGGDVSTAPIKGFERALAKALDGCNVNDLARNTIVVDAGSVDSAVDDLARAGANVWEFTLDNNDLGYTGFNTTVVTESGLRAEIQVNTPEMIFAKEPEGIARSILGDDAYDSLVVARGDVGGQGHKFYEQHRVLQPNDPEALRIAQESRDYYAQFRQPAVTQ